MRDAGGKELRYPVILSWIEKDIAFKIYHAFKQTVCGFDRGRKRVTQRRFNMSVIEAIPERKASTPWVRPER